MKKKIVLFTNNERSINIIHKLKKKHKIKLIILSKKNLSKNLDNQIRKFKIKTLYFENNLINLKKKIQMIDPDFLICCGFPKKISKDIINLPKYCSINLHGGKVPSYLGASTINWQIINGEKKIYISCIKMNEKIDGGPLILQKYVHIKQDENVDKIKIKLNKIFPYLCLKAINNILKKKKVTYYRSSIKTFWKQRSKKDSKISLDKFNRLHAHNTIRGSSEKNYPAYIYFKNQKIILYKSKLINKNLTFNKKYLVKNNKMFINFVDGTLKIEKFKIYK